MASLVGIFVFILWLLLFLSPCYVYFSVFFPFALYILFNFPSSVSYFLFSLYCSLSLSFSFFLSYYLFLSLSSLFQLYGINISICLSIYRYVWVCTYHFLSHINASILRKYNMKKIIIQNSQCLVIENGSIFPFPLHRKRN